MRVAFVVGTLARGGAETLVKGLCRSLAGKHAMMVVCALGKSGVFVEEIEELGVKVVGLDHRSLRNARSVAELARYWGLFRPDIVHTHLEASLAQQVLASRLGGCKNMVVTCHHVFGHLKRAQIIRGRLQGRLVRRAKVQPIAVSNAVRLALGDYWGTSPIRIRVILNGIDFKKYRPREPRDVARRRLGWELDSDIIVSVGNFRPQKDHITLIQAFSIVAREDRRARLILVGDGPLRETLRELVHSLGIANVVRFLGSVDDVPRLLWGADIFALASRLEGFGLAVVEAVVAQKPVVVSRIPAFVEVLQGNADASLVPVGDVQGFASALLRGLAIARSGAVGLENAAAAAVSQFSLERCFREYQALYRSFGNSGSSRDKDSVA